MLPRKAFQVTAVLVVVPWTEALNGKVLPTIACGAAGKIATEVTSALALACSGMMIGLALALLIRLSVPSVEPEALASKVTVKFCAAPGASVNGAVSPLTAKPVPVI